MAYLADMFHQHPANYRASHRRTWGDSAIELHSIWHGLTAFHRVNNLAILNICLPPMRINGWMKIMIWMPFEDSLGFTLSTGETIYMALMIIYDHLDNVLPNGIPLC
jgi:hypothetical protein